MSFFQNKFGKMIKTLRNQYEVDFIANRGCERYYIQSAFMMPTTEKERQELTSMMNIDDSLKKSSLSKTTKSLNTMKAES